MRPTRPASLALLAVALLAAPARAQTPGWATVDVSGSITASLDLVQASNSFGPGGELSLFFIEPGASIGSNNTELDLFSSAPLGVGTHPAPACGFAPECAVSIFITPVSPEEGTLSNAGSSARGQGDCSMTIDLVDAQGVSGSFDCTWAEIAVTAHGEFDTTAGAGESGTGDGGEGADEGGGSNLPLWLVLGTTGTAVAAAGAEAVRRRRRRRKKEPEPSETDCSQYEAQFNSANREFLTARSALAATLKEAGLSSRDQIPTLRGRLERLQQAIRGLNQAWNTSGVEELAAEAAGHVATVKQLSAQIGAQGSRVNPDGFITMHRLIDGWANRLGGSADQLLAETRRVVEATASFGSNLGIAHEESLAGSVRSDSTRIRGAVAELEAAATKLWTNPSPEEYVIAGTVLPGIERDFVGSADDAAEQLTMLLRGQERAAGEARSIEERYRGLQERLESQDQDLRRKQEAALAPWRRLVSPPCNQMIEYGPLEPKA